MSIKMLYGFVEELYAVELLEYNNKNWLASGTNPCKLSEEKQSLLRTILCEVKKLDDATKMEESRQAQRLEEIIKLRLVNHLYSELVETHQKAVGAIAALSAELAEIDRIAGNRSIFDDCKTRAEKFQKAINIARGV